METNEKLIVDMFTAGITMRTIAKHFGCTYQKISYVIARTGLTKLDDEEIIKLYVEEKMSPAAIGKIYELNSSTISRRLKKSEVEIRNISEAKQKWTLNDSYFKYIDSEEKAYWLGMMFADGYVKSNLRDFGLTLKSTDRVHIEKLAKAIEYDGPIFDGESTREFGTFKYSRIVPSSRESCRHLISHGCVPRKTHITEEPIGVSEKFTRDFVRGIVDGDGGIYLYDKSSSMEIVGDYRLLDWISTQGPSNLTQPQKHKSIFRIRTNSKNVYEWVSWLYEKPKEYLDRKYITAQKVIDRGF